MLLRLTDLEKEIVSASLREKFDKPTTNERDMITLINIANKLGLDELSEEMESDMDFEYSLNYPKR